MSLTPTQSNQSEDSPPGTPRLIRTSFDFTRSNLFDEENRDSQHEEEREPREEYYDDINRDLFCDICISIQLEEEDNENNYDTFLQHDDSNLFSSFRDHIEEEYNEDNDDNFPLQHDVSELFSSFNDHIEEEYNQESDDTSLQRDDSFSISNENNTMPNSHDLYYSSGSQLDDFYVSQYRDVNYNKETGYSGDDESDSPPESSNFYIYKDLFDKYQISTIKEEEHNDEDDDSKANPQH